MEIEIKDWDNIIAIESKGENDIYTISITFLNHEAMTYGYVDKKKWLLDYNKLLNKYNRRL